MTFHQSSKPRLEISRPWIDNHLLPTNHDCDRSCAINLVGNNDDRFPTKDLHSYMTVEYNGILDL